MLNKKGFTLIELIIIITILGVISVMAIPNIINIQQKNTKKQYIQDAKDYIVEFQYQEKTNTNLSYTLVRCAKTNINVYNISNIKRIKIEKSPNGNTYEGQVAKIGNNYAICLSENSDKGKTVIATLNDLYEDDAITRVYDKQSGDCIADSGKSICDAIK